MQGRLGIVRHLVLSCHTPFKAPIQWTQVHVEFDSNFSPHKDKNRCTCPAGSSETRGIRYNSRGSSLAPLSDSLVRRSPHAHSTLRSFVPRFGIKIAIRQDNHSWIVV
ncbi:hypothetical protein BDN72DRAFT_550054 [Pluteus cervinus]|uniref:Uncharacterized protein n=1 Tax=Pluteus cervinus TaxID=181527 RepID=A0ACD3A3Y6_9AGAR|nr:hypothetical protein BDN72DRAFT_550054 [Pluteus cervinus]